MTCAYYIYVLDMKIKVNSTYGLSGVSRGEILALPHSSQPVYHEEIEAPRFITLSKRRDRLGNVFLDILVNAKLDGYISLTYITSRTRIDDVADFSFLDESRYVKLKDMPVFKEDVILNAIEFVKSRIKYDSTQTSVKSASASLDRGYGVCVNFAHAFIGIMRRNGIPARIAVGIPPGTNYASHAWCQVKVNGKWIEVDPTAGVVRDTLPYVLWGIGEDEARLRSKVVGVKPRIMQSHRVEFLQE